MRVIEALMKNNSTPGDQCAQNLRDIKLKPEYNTEDNDIIRDFYAPCLRVSEAYDRAVGYFRANIYRELGEDLLDFVIKGGKVRIVCSRIFQNMMKGGKGGI